MVDTIVFSVRVSPNAKQDTVLGLWQENILKIALNAPAVDGKANKALVAFLSKELKIRKSSIFIVTGETSRCKLISIQSLSEQDKKRIEAWLVHK